MDGFSIFHLRLLCKGFCWGEREPESIIFIFELLQPTNLGCFNTLHTGIHIPTSPQGSDKTITSSSPSHLTEVFLYYQPKTLHYKKTTRRDLKVNTSKLIACNIYPSSWILPCIKLDPPSKKGCRFNDSLLHLYFPWQTTPYSPKWCVLMVIYHGRKYSNL